MLLCLGVCIFGGCCCVGKYIYCAHQSRHTHASHIHTHNTMYAHVYICTHCGCKGHLAKFCYDRIHNINFANKFVWVRKGANPDGPKKVWVPKSTPIVFDVSVGFHLT